MVDTKNLTSQFQQFLAQSKISKLHTKFKTSLVSILLYPFANFHQAKFYLLFAFLLINYLISLHRFPFAVLVSSTFFFRICTHDSTSFQTCSYSFISLHFFCNSISNLLQYPCSKLQSHAKQFYFLSLPFFSTFLLFLLACLISSA